MPRLKVMAIVLLLAGAARAGEFEDGLSEFRRAAATGDPVEAKALYREAAATWEALYRGGNASTRLLTNIGNARAFAGDLGEAVLAYRRALLADPGNDRARDGLDAIRHELGVEDRRAGAGSGLLHALFFWHDMLTARTRTILFAIAWIGGMALLVPARRRRKLRPAAALLLLVAGALFSSLFVTDRERRDAADAVLTVRTEGRAGDGEFYSPSHSSPLPAGIEIRILERREDDGGWVHGQLRDGTKTWLPARSVETVLPSSRGF